ncbi:MAG: hypothetical protein ACRC24_08525 [Vibrionaceae bacterium]
MPSILEAQCPKCGKIARADLNAIEKEFGFRNVNGKRIVQSHCRDCRSTSQKRKNSAAEKE